MGKRLDPLDTLAELFYRLGRGIQRTQRHSHVPYLGRSIGPSRILRGGFGNAKINNRRTVC